MKSKIVSSEISPNIYLYKKGGQTFLYAPFKQLVVRGGVKIGLIRNLIKKIHDVQQVPQVIHSPTTVTLDLTHNCPLGCVYCSVDSGRDKGVMDEEIGKHAIDIIIGNAKKTGSQKIGVVFGGGGEPTVAWPVLQKLISYAWGKTKKHRVEGQILLATGGILSQDKVKWLAQNVTHIALSFDGPAKVQNAHRPLKDGKSSFEKVVNTALTLGKIKADFSIRAAISDLNSNLPALVEFFSQFSPKFLNFQPIVICGRCYRTGWKGLEPDRFVREFIKARTVAKKYNLPIIFPGSRIDRIIPEVCHAYNGTGFVVASSGLVSACERVLSNNDNLADIFLYGRFHREKFLFDEKQLRKLRNFKVDKIRYCVNCFARWHCQGGCLNDHLSQSESKRNPFSRRTNAMCYTTREIVYHLLDEIAKGGEENGKFFEKAFGYPNRL